MLEAQRCLPLVAMWKQKPSGCKFPKLLAMGRIRQPNFHSRLFPGISLLAQGKLELLGKHMEVDVGEDGLKYEDLNSDLSICI